MIDSTYTTKIKIPVTTNADCIEVIDFADLCDQIETPSHVFLTIYTAMRSETVIAYACEDNKVKVQRGVSGTSACLWPAQACVKVDQIIDGAICIDNAEVEAKAEALAKVIACLPLGKGLQWNQDDPNNVFLELAPTTVVAGEVCGAKVNSCGQFTFIPENWPAACIPVYDPCCKTSEGGTGNGETPEAYSIPFVAQDVLPKISATNVGGALENLHTAICNVEASIGVGVSSVVAGKGITLGGTTTNPVVDITTVFSAGTYGAFEVNDCGQITGYTPVPTDVLEINPGDCMQVTYNGSAYTIDVNIASVNEEGCVSLADEGEILNDPANISGGGVVTADYLQQWATSNGLI